MINQLVDNVFGNWTVRPAQKNEHVHTRMDGFGITGLCCTCKARASFFSERINIDFFLVEEV